MSSPLLTSVTCFRPTSPPASPSASPPASRCGGVTGSSRCSGLRSRYEVDDLTGLPLALSADGRLFTFGVPANTTIFVASGEQRTIFASRPWWFLDEAFSTACGLDQITPDGVSRMTPADVVRLLPHLLPKASPQRLPTDPDAGHFPTVAWLTLLYEYLTTAVRKGFRPAQEALQQVPLVPDQDGTLCCPGAPTTPLLARELNSETLRTVPPAFPRADPHRSPRALRGDPGV